MLHFFFVGLACANEFYKLLTREQAYYRMEW